MSSYSALLNLAGRMRDDAVAVWWRRGKRAFGAEAQELEEA